MGRKKGSKNKNSQGSSVESATQYSASNVNPDISDGGIGSIESDTGTDPTPASPGSDLGFDNRASIYESYRQSQEAEVIELDPGVKEPEIEPLSGVNDNVDNELGEKVENKELNTDTPTEEGVTGASEFTAPEDKAKIDVDVEKQSSVDTGTKVVPYDALHAEREKRKDIQGQLDKVLQDYKKLEEASKQESISDIGIEDYDDPAFKKLNAENKELRDAITRIESRFIQDDESKVMSKVNTDVDSVDKDLSSEGFPGFKDFGQNLVVQRLNEIAGTKGEEEAQVYRNPEGWKILWKEIFPKVNSVFSGKNRSEDVLRKKDLKAGAGLAGSPGQAPKDEKKSDVWTYDDYLKSREKAAA